MERQAARNARRRRNDDKLRVQGRLQQEEADTRRKARLAEADAAQRRRQADIRERQDAVAAERLKVQAEIQSDNEQHRNETDATR